jgi:hypothetical protein
VIALTFQKFMIIVSTGFWGAWSVVTNIERFFRSGGGQLYAIFLCWLALGFAGVIVQFTNQLQ